MTKTPAQKHDCESTVVRRGSREKQAELRRKATAYDRLMAEMDSGDDDRLIWVTDIRAILGGTNGKKI